MIFFILLTHSLTYSFIQIVKADEAVANEQAMAAKAIKDGGGGLSLIGSLFCVLHDLVACSSLIARICILRITLLSRVLGIDALQGLQS